MKARPWLLLILCAVVASAIAGAIGRLDATPATPKPRVLRIAMNTSDLPTTTGAPSQGLEGLRFAGYPVFEPLVMWDLRVTDRIPGVIPWLAESWTVDAADRNRWTFRLRRGVTFHDGSPFDADAVIWNLHRYFDTSAPQWDAAGGAWARSRAPILKSWEKIDDHTVVISTSTPTSYFPEVLTTVLFVSPARWRELKGDWQAFAQRPAGTGAFRIDEVNRTAITMSRNPAYWNRARAAKVDGVKLYAMGEPTTRVAALRSGEVDWVENPPADALPFLRKAGYQIATSPMPHVWAYFLRSRPGGPFHDLRVRQAMNYAIDREGIVTLLNGAARPAQGFWEPEDRRFGQPTNRYAYDPARSRALLKAAGYPADKLVPVRVLTTPVASGQMLSLPMNELLQQSAAKAGFKLEFMVVEGNQMNAMSRNDSPKMGDIDIYNKGYNTGESTYLYYWMYPPNIANYFDKASKELLDEYRVTFDPVERDAILLRLHERFVDDAPMAWVVHDVNPRAFAPNVRGYTPARSWYTDLTTIYLTD
ncbi:ABC transporter substrate-binding protein [Phenylobacterium sp.]|uniref:ABC transporter substrate-binding protein n=1 Tax=Phenylobacterium sp. TaxID=1871053 RepID=UPI00301E4D99